MRILITRQNFALDLCWLIPYNIFTISVYRVLFWFVLTENKRSFCQPWMVFFFQVLCKWWIKQGGSWNREVPTSSMLLWRHQCAAHPALLFSLENMSTITTPILTMRTAPLHPGKLSMKYAHLQCTSITRDTGQVRPVYQMVFNWQLPQTLLHTVVLAPIFSGQLSNMFSKVEEEGVRGLVPGVEYLS